MTSTKLVISALGATVAALIAFGAVQHQGLARLQDENQDLRQQVDQLGQLQAENERLSNMVAHINSGSSLSENQLRDLARLRAEVERLRAQTNETEQVQDENQRIRAELPTAVAAIMDSEALEEANREQCISNLTLIEAAKAQWASDHNKQDSEVPRMHDLVPYFPGQKHLSCPDFGTYFLGTVGRKARCEIPGHELP
jgi:DNA repair exonuclease SbcCD ATPase subunit